MNKIACNNSDVKKVLNVGGNSKNVAIPSCFDGWQHDLLDIDPAVNPDILCDARELCTMLPKQYDAIHCSHNLEHYYSHEVPKVLEGFKWLLKDNGFVSIVVPNLMEAMKRVVNENIELDGLLYVCDAGPITPMDVIYGLRKQIEFSGVDYFAHKTGFSTTSLTKYLIDCGFPYVFINNDDFLDISARAFMHPPSSETSVELGLSSVKISSMLDSIDIELSGHCNLNCTFCPRDKMTREKSFLSLELLKKLLEEIFAICPDGPRNIYFCGLGEPLLNNNLCDFADNVNGVFPDTLVIVVSNGVALNQELCDDILSSSVFSFTCSVQSIIEQQFEKVMCGTAAQFDSVMHWTKYLAEKRGEAGLQLTVSYVKTTQTDKEIEEYFNYWKKLGVLVGEQKLHTRGGNLCEETISENRLVKSCSLFESRLFVAANGDVLACCQDLDGQSKLGNIGVDSLMTILKRKVAKIQEGFLYPMCANCNDENTIISL